MACDLRDVGMRRVDLDSDSWRAWEEKVGAGFRTKSSKPKLSGAAKRDLKGLTANFEDAKLNDRESDMQRITQQVGTRIRQEYGNRGAVSGAAAAVIGPEAVAMIAKNVVNKATREYNGDHRILATRQRFHEHMAGEATARGDLKSMAASMVLAHTYRALAEKAQRAFDRKKKAFEKKRGRTLSHDELESVGRMVGEELARIDLGD